MNLYGRRGNRNEHGKVVIEDGSGMVVEEISKEEVLTAVRSMRNGKAGGVYEWTRDVFSNECGGALRRRFI